MCNRSVGGEREREKEGGGGVAPRDGGMLEKECEREQGLFNDQSSVITSQ